MVKPESGGLVRYPRYSTGRMVSAVLGFKWIPEPWMSIIVGLVALGVFYAAVANRVWYMPKTGLDQSLRAEFARSDEAVASEA